MYTLSIKLRGFDTRGLRDGAQQIETLYRTLSPGRSVQPPGIIALPEQRSHITVLRSPHIDKKSREQFVFKRMQALLSYRFKNLGALRLFLLGLGCLECTGVEIALQLRSWDYYIESL